MAFTESEWFAHVPLTINHEKVPATMPDGGESGFATQFGIKNGGANWEGDAAKIFAKVNNYANDIAIVLPDGSTQLRHVIKEYNGAGGSELLVAHILVPSIAGATDTDVWLYYRDDGAADQQQTVYLAADHWAAYYSLHEAAAGIGTASVYKDLSEGAHHGTDNVSAAGKTGQVGLGQELDGTDDYVLIPDHDDFTPASGLTVLCWVNPDSWVTDNKGMVAQFLGAGNQRSWVLLGVPSAGDGLLYGAVSANGSGSVNSGSAGTLGTGSWRHCGFTWEPSTAIRAYIDGSEGAVNTTSIPASLHNSTADVWIGSQYDLVTGADQSFFDGLVDEVAIRSVASSANWIATTRNCQFDPDFWTVGSEVLVSKLYRLRRFNPRIIVPGMNPGFMTF